ncbi:MAG: glycerophosphodiester phosphodiesterase [Gammaproteobacteria bacterium]|mgnify:FL=1|jgi:glycerophosphoryl diester phosphodiesterase|nr:glycerophosphodiester phosphodiesterase [Gammaproteobacteria bacterium]|tara:strand:- start:1397 stop:2089 length:693 start_codon:yes stop_codon:yes gene_type:complete
MPNLLCIGHRGACGHEPENTLNSFNLAVAMGSPWIELDVYSVEGELLVIHDDSLERTTNGVGEVMASSLEYLRSLDAGGGQQIPSLREVTELVDQRCSINVELKGPDTALPVSRFLAGLCDEGWDSHAFLLSSFDHAELAKADPRFRRGALFNRASPDYFTRTADLHAYSINLSSRLVSRELIDEAHSNGLKVYVYTVNEADEIRQMDMLGVDGVFSDFPDRVLSIFGNS